MPPTQQFLLFEDDIPPDLMRNLCLQELNKRDKRKHALIKIYRVIEREICITRRRNNTRSLYLRVQLSATVIQNSRH